MKVLKMKTLKPETIEICKRVIQIFEEEKIVAADLAKKIHTSKGYISNVLNFRQGAGDKIIYALRDFYKINPEWIRTGQGDMFLDDEAETEEYQKELAELSEMMGKDPKLIKDIIQATVKDPDLMRLAAQVVNDNDKTSRARFIKLTE
jgi:transcriptional regulator with XRE-family HTH domain